jgi:hypothetical protein
LANSDGKKRQGENNFWRDVSDCFDKH